MITSAVIGVGSHHGDDNVGWLALDILQQKFASNVELQFSRCERSIMDWWDFGTEVKRWHFIDAIKSEAAPGSIHCIEMGSGIKRNHFQSLSSHGISLFDAIQLADQLGTLPEKVLVWGIEMQNHQVGAGLSSVVMDSVPKLVDSLGYFLMHDKLDLSQATR